MQTGKWAAIAAGGVLSVVALTFAVTQIMAPANRFEDCVRGRTVGGAIGGPFELLNGAGETVTDADVITGPTLVYFGYTFCPDVCPVDVARNAIVIDILQEQDYDITPVFISVDPNRDTPEFTDNYAKNHHPDMIGLTGSPEQIAKAARAYKVYYQRPASDDEEYYIMDHSTFSYLMLPDIGFVDFFRNDLSPEQMANQIGCILDAA